MTTPTIYDLPKLLQLPGYCLSVCQIDSAATGIVEEITYARGHVFVNTGDKELAPAFPTTSRFVWRDEEVIVFGSENITPHYRFILIADDAKPSMLRAVM